TAVLAGDALQALAFEVLASAAPHADPSVVVEAVGDLSRACGSRQLVGGQVDDLAVAARVAAGVPPHPAGEDAASRIESIHARKSAALIAASISGGARFAPGARPEDVARLQRFGEGVGVAFQIADDLIDRDDEEPCSLVGVLGVESAAKRAEALLTDALNEIAALDERAEPLRDLARFAVRRQA
nr:polyprenyl synthetase family protein [Myxococcota bacterium]